MSLRRFSARALRLYSRPFVSGGFILLGGGTIKLFYVECDIILLQTNTQVLLYRGEYSSS